MEQTDILYALLLCISVALGYVIKRVDAGRTREVVSSAVGVCMVSVICGSHGLHSLVIVIGNALIILAFNPRICHILSFIWCFGYLLFFRTTQYFGLPEVPGHADASQLLLTLKIVGLAFEVSDSYKNKQKLMRGVDEATKDEYEYREINPGLLDILLYSYCYIGILTGPYYSYCTYRDMMNNENANKVAINVHLLKRLKLCPLVFILYILVPMVYPVEYTKSAEIFERPMWYRVWYTIPLCLGFRLRCYSAWLLAESMCITSTLGAYPTSCWSKNGRGPTDVQHYNMSRSTNTFREEEYDFISIECLDILPFETLPSFRGAFKAWNSTVQFWMAHHVYKRWPVRSMSVLVTFAVSSYWHGIHFGYYLFFFTLVLGSIVEVPMRAAFRQRATPERQKLFDWLWWVVVFRTFDYASIPFLLLSWNDIYKYWSSIYFCGHIILIILALVSQTYVYVQRKNRPTFVKESKDNNLNDKKNVLCDINGKRAS